MLTVVNSTRAKNFLVVMGSLFAGDHGNDACGLYREAVRSLFAPDAVEAFNEVLAMEREHNALSLLHSFGWRENCPDPSFWSFTNDQFPGVVVYWHHGDNRGFAP